MAMDAGIMQLQVLTDAMTMTKSAMARIGEHLVCRMCDNRVPCQLLRVSADDVATADWEEQYSDYDCD
jgi:hypothetical protein